MLPKYTRINCPTCGGGGSMRCPRCDGSGRTHYVSTNIHENVLICEKIWNDMSSEEVEKYLNEFNIESTSSISNSLKQTIVKSYLYDLNLESE